VRFGKSNSHAFKFPREAYYANGTPSSGVYTILDTGVSSLYISRLWFDSFIEELAKVAKSTFQSHNGRLYTLCSNEFPSIYFLIDGIYLEVAKKDYVVDVSQQQDGSICLVQIAATDSPFLILGMPLFVDYTTVFDDLESTVDFWPTKGSAKGELKSEAIPKQALRLLTDFEISEYSEYVADTFATLTFGFVVATYIFLLY